MNAKYGTLSVTHELKQTLKNSCRGKETWSERIQRALKAEAELREILEGRTSVEQILDNRSSSDVAVVTETAFAAPIVGKKTHRKVPLKLATRVKD
ncbi:MAG: hypothetical protein ACHQ03_12000 [Candidatus Bathyarchaeia archaeon]